MKLACIVDVLHILMFALRATIVVFTRFQVVADRSCPETYIRVIRLLKAVLSQRDAKDFTSTSAQAKIDSLSLGWALFPPHLLKR